jgi:acetoin utilization protein AcuB
MRRRFITVSPEETLGEARQIMRLARLRHLLVARDGFLLGLLTYRDLMEQLLDADPDGNGSIGRLHEPVSEVMIPLPYAVTPDKSLSHAASRLWQLRIGCLPVVETTDEGDRLLGLLTEADLLRAAYDPLLHNEV